MTPRCWHCGEERDLTEPTVPTLQTENHDPTNPIYVSCICGRYIKVEPRQHITIPLGLCPHHRERHET